MLLESAWVLLTLALLPHVMGIVTRVETEVITGCNQESITNSLVVG